MRSTSTLHKTIAVLVAVLTGIYMLPWAIAVVRESGNTTSVFWVNLLTGWTLVGWIVALFMSLRAVR